MSKHITGMIAVAQSKGACLAGVSNGIEVCRENTVESRDSLLILGMSNKTLKKSLAGDGSATKEDMATAADIRHDIQLDDDDQVDAFAAANFGANFISFLLRGQAHNNWYEGMPLDEAQKMFMKDINKFEEGPFSGEDVSVTAVLRSAKNFKENFGQYKYDKIRKEILEL